MSGYLDLLQLISPEIILPQAVATEIEAYGTNDITAKALAKTEWLIVIEIPTITNYYSKLEFRCRRIRGFKLGLSSFRY